MILSNSLRTALVLVSLYGLATASEFKYQIEGGSVQTWPSKEEYNQSLQDFLDDEKRIEEYIKIKKNLFRDANLEKVEELSVITLDSIRRDSSRSYGRQMTYILPFLGGFVGGLFGAGFQVNHECSPLLMGGAIGAGLFGLYGYNFMYNNDKLFNPSSPTYECVENRLSNDIYCELFNKNYLVATNVAPTLEASNKIKTFVNRIMSSQD